MTQKGSPTLGDVYNWHEITDVQVVAASATNLTDGMFVYQDAANGLKVVPTSSIPEAGRIRFLPTGYDNSSGTLGDRELETVKHNAIVVAKCDGAITVGDRVVASGTTAGRCAARAATAAAIEVVIGTYLGHVGELEGTGNDPTNASDGDLVVIQMI